MKLRKKRSRSLARIVWGWLIFILLLLLLILGGMYFLNQKILVRDSSMLPVLSQGDEVWADRLLYHIKSPSRFDIVVFSHPYQQETQDVKRIIALPGETVQIKDGYVYVNGALLDDPYGVEPVSMAGLASTVITLDENEYFVLGDNRNASADSREPTIGNIQRENIIGKVLLVARPLRHLKWLG